MKKFLTAFAALMLIVAITASALAVTMYVVTDQAKVRKKPNKKADVISRLPKSISVDVFETSGNWSHINYINRKGKQKSGWIANKHLSATQPHKHSWGKWVETQKAACGKKGKKERVCTTCGKKETKNTKKLKHKWSQWVVTRNASCIADGETTRRCTLCGKTETKSVGKVDHRYGPWTVQTNATCTELGVQVRVCTVCGNRDTAPIEQGQHTFGEWRTAVPLTRDTNGERIRTCTRCGAEVRKVIKTEPSAAMNDNNAVVKSAQSILAELGYSVDQDGIYGASLDTAYRSFANDHAVVFTEGSLKPVHMDALMGTWVKDAPQEKWLGNDGSLFLSMGPTGESGDIMIFNWSLTNSGSDTVTVKGIMMGGTANFNFREGGMAAAMGFDSLAPGNTISGTFNLPMTFGQGKEALSFCAVAEVDGTGSICVSNTINRDMVAH